MKTIHTQSFEVIDGVKVLFCTLEDNEHMKIVIYIKENDGHRVHHHEYAKKINKITPTKKLAVEIVNDILTMAEIWSTHRRYLDFIDLFGLEDNHENKKLHQVWRTWYCFTQNCTMKSIEENRKKFDELYPIDVPCGMGFALDRV